MSRAGSELSILGLYGLLYGCLAGPAVPNPSTFLHVVFGDKGPGFETEEAAKMATDNLMTLWNAIGQWEPETEDLILPEFDYPGSIDGAITQIADILDLAGYFLKGLELVGVAEERLFGEMNEYAESFARTTLILHTYAELLEKKEKQGPKQIKKMMESIDNGQYVIHECIAEMSAALRRVGQEQHLKIGRNDPCPCGSGKKYKKCCGLTH